MIHTITIAVRKTCCRLLVGQALSGGGQRATVALMEMPVTVAMRLQKGIDRVYPSKPDLLRSKRDLLPCWRLVSGAP